MVYVIVVNLFISLLRKQRSISQKIELFLKCIHSPICYYFTVFSKKCHLPSNKWCHVTAEKQSPAFIVNMYNVWSVYTISCFCHCAFTTAVSIILIYSIQHNSHGDFLSSFRLIVTDFMSNFYQPSHSNFFILHSLKFNVHTVIFFQHTLITWICC